MNKKKILIFLCMVILILPVVSSMNSSNYSMETIISSGGVNTSSNNYQNDVVAGTISGKTNSSLYEILIGWFFGEGYTSIPVSVPVCGDGVLDAGEGCDDGNVVGGDGCSSSCVVEIAGGVSSGGGVGASIYVYPICDVTQFEYGDPESEPILSLDLPTNITLDEPMRVDFQALYGGVQITGASTFHLSSGSNQVEFSISEGGAISDVVESE